MVCSVILFFLSTSILFCTFSDATKILGVNQCENKFVSSQAPPEKKKFTEKKVLYIETHINFMRITLKSCSHELLMNYSNYTEKVQKKHSDEEEIKKENI